MIIRKGYAKRMKNAKLTMEKAYTRTC